MHPATRLTMFKTWLCPWLHTISMHIYAHACTQTQSMRVFLQQMLRTSFAFCANSKSCRWDPGFALKQVKAPRPTWPCLKLCVSMMSIRCLCLWIVQFESRINTVLLSFVPMSNPFRMAMQDNYMGLTQQLLDGGCMIRLWLDAT